MYGEPPGSGSFPQVVAVPLTDTVRPSALEQPQPLIVPLTVKQAAPVVPKLPLWPPLTALQVPLPLEPPLEDELELELEDDDELELPPELELLLEDEELEDEELELEDELDPEDELELPLDEEQQPPPTAIPFTLGLSGPPPLVKAITSCPSALVVALNVRATAFLAPPAAAKMSKAVSTLAPPMLTSKVRCPADVQ